MSLLNKFVAPELKIKPKNRKASKVSSRMHSKPISNLASTVKAGLPVSASYGSVKGGGLGGGGL